MLDPYLINKIKTIFRNILIQDFEDRLIYLDNEDLDFQNVEEKICEKHITFIFISYFNDSLILIT
jgi:hypothetical protein